MELWILLAPGILLVLIPLVNMLEFQIRLRRRVRRDFLNARGTLHRRVIEGSLERLNKRISETEDEIKQVSMRRSRLRKEKERELETALTTQIVNSELTMIPGIGSVLKDRIISQCFNGTLESLHQADNIQGIGEEKRQAIYKWVKRTRAKMPQLLLEDFPEKSKILMKYADFDKKMEQTLKTNNVELQTLQKLREEANTALYSLKRVSQQTFLGAYKGGGEAAKMVTQYLIGVYPEWERSPAWFKTLMEEYGGT